MRGTFEELQLIVSAQGTRQTWNRHTCHGRREDVQQRARLFNS
jgi:hypothetical protein